LPKIREALADVEHCILVLSGKGGVGKSTFTAQIAYGLAAQDYQVGVLDVDICGPSMPRIMGVEGENIRKSAVGWTPVYRHDNLGVVSAGFLIPSADDAVIWRGPKKNGLIKQFLRDVDWGALDCLVIDTPPGTSDEHISIVSALAQCQPDGALLITTPQDVALNDVRKEISFCRKVGLPILGLVENMSGFVCPKCKKGTDVFQGTSGGGRALCEEKGIRFLGSVPLDPMLARACDEGRDLASETGTPSAEAYKNVLDGVKAVLSLGDPADD